MVEMKENYSVGVSLFQAMQMGIILDPEILVSLEICSMSYDVVNG